MLQKWEKDADDKEGEEEEKEEEEKEEGENVMSKADQLSSSLIFPLLWYGADILADQE